MNKATRFPVNFFKSFRDDPILDESVGRIENPRALTESDRLSSLAAVFDAPFASDPFGEGPDTSREGDERGFDLRKRDYVVNSIFAPDDLREEPARPLQQLHFVKENQGVIVGLHEINSLLYKGWRVVDAYTTGNSAFYKALVLLEKQV